MNPNPAIACPVVILAGGLGTRLQSVVSDVPKPLAQVAGRPFVERLIDQAKRYGASEVILCAGHLAEVVQRYYGDGSKLDITIRISVEPIPLGTAGAIALAMQLFADEQFIAMNGDSFAGIDLQELLLLHRRREALGTITVKTVEDTSRYGRVDLAEDMQVRSFVEKGSAAGPGYINCGVYAFSREVFTDVAKDAPTSLERDVLPRLAGHGLYGAPYHGAFIDVGTPEDYLKAQTFF